ncbi:MAG: PEPxxWA-CTERM sorting domain-containing protein [Sphingomonadales bacterium]|jgi:autoaggregation protein RapA/B/C
MKRIVLALVAALLSPVMLGAAHAEDWQVTKVRDTGNGFTATAIDPQTGMYYSKQGYGFEGPYVQTYRNAAAFEKGRSNGTIQLQGETTSGTYMTVVDGKLIARTYGPALDEWGYPDGNTIGSWDLTTGQFNGSAAMPGMTGRNGADSFNWGGFSAVNVMQDQTGTYVLGTDGTGVWTLNKIDAALNVLDQRSFNAPTLGFAFMKHGQLFLGNSFYTPRIDQRFDFASGTMTDTDINLVGFQSPYDFWPAYLSNTAYDMNRDVVYFHNTMDNSLYRLGAAPGGVPEPASWALLIAGFGLAGMAMRRRATAAVRA